MKKHEFKKRKENQDNPGELSKPTTHEILYLGSIKKVNPKPI
jgi:hypothetical protein